MSHVPEAAQYCRRSRCALAASTQGRARQVSADASTPIPSPAADALPSRLDNTLPGRDTFDIEIYGMEGIPQADLDEWQARKAAQTDGSGPDGAGGMGRPSKKPKVEKKIISADILKAQLEAHKALMAGKAPPPGSLSALAVMGPPPSLNGPPPPMAGPPPGFPYAAPPFSGPPPGFMGAAPAYSGPPPIPSAGAAAPPAVPAPIPQPSPHQRAVKAGVKSRVVYTDSELCAEEKLASTSKYVYLDPEDPEDAKKLQARQQASVLPGWQQIRQSQTQQSTPAQSNPAVPPPTSGAGQSAEALAAANEAIAANPAIAVQREKDMQVMQENAAEGAAQDLDLGGEPEQTAAKSEGAVAGQKRARAADLF